MNEEKPLAETTKNRKDLAVFAASSFLNDFGSDMIYPVWPRFVRSLPQSNMAILGLLDGTGDAVVSISQAISGYVSDRIGRRKIFIWTGYLCGSMSRVGYAFSSFWAHLVPFKILDRAGKIRGAPRDAMIADLSTYENRGRNFGLLRAMDNLGAVCGIITCLLLFSLLGYQTLFLFAAVPSLISTLLILFFIKERKTKKIFRGISLQDLTFNLKLFLLISAVFALGNFSYSFLLVYAQEILVDFPVEAFIGLYLVFTVVASVASFPFGRLADKIGRKTVLALSYLFWGVMCLGFITFQIPVGIVLMFVLYGLHKAAIEPVQRAFVSELCPENLRASFLGAFQMVIGLCALPASLIAGILWTGLGRHAPFSVSLALTLVAIALMAFLKEQNRKK